MDRTYRNDARGSVDDGHRFRVLVAGRSWQSQQVVQALHDLCDAHGVTTYDIEVVDLVERPELADEYRVLALPMVMRMSPGPLVRVVGDLRDAAVAADMLGLSRGPSPRDPDQEEASP